MKKIWLFGAVVLSLILVGSGWGAVINVPGDMDLQSALDTAEINGEDDTINIAAGTYDASGSTFSYSPAAGNNSLIIAGAGAGSVMLDGGTSKQVMYINTMGLGDDSNGHITVTGITFQNGSQTGGPEAGGGLYVRTIQANITVEDCEFRGNVANLEGGGLYVETDQANITVEDCEFSGNTVGFSGGDGGGGVDGRSSSGNVIFTNNIFNGNTVQNAGGAGTVSSSQGTITFTNNTSVGNTVNNGDGGGFHITLELNTATGNIYNNIVWNNTASGNGDDIYVDNSTGASVNLFNNDYGDSAIAAGGSLSQGNNINIDPVLVDPASEDFHLQTTSPCINAGTAAAPSLPPTDCDGEQRNSGSAPDIGADEVPATSGGGGGFCFIATAAYGSAVSNEVTIFKQFRDEFLLPNELGRSFVSAYYRYSPGLADYIAKHPMGRKMVRIGLYPILELSKWFVEENDSKQPSKEAE